MGLEEESYLGRLAGEAYRKLSPYGSFLRDAPGRLGTAAYRIVDEAPEAIGTALLGGAGIGARGVWDLGGAIARSAPEPVSDYLLEPLGETLIGVGSRTLPVVADAITYGKGAFNYGTSRFVKPEMTFEEAKRVSPTEVFGREKKPGFRPLSNPLDAIGDVTDFTIEAATDPTNLIPGIGVVKAPVIKGLAGAAMTKAAPIVAAVKAGGGVGPLPMMAAFGPGMRLLKFFSREGSESIASGAAGKIAAGSVEEMAERNLLDATGQVVGVVEKVFGSSDEPDYSLIAKYLRNELPEGKSSEEVLHGIASRGGGMPLQSKEIQKRISLVNQADADSVARLSEAILNTRNVTGEEKSILVGAVRSVADLTKKYGREVDPRDAIMEYILHYGASTGLPLERHAIAHGHLRKRFGAPESKSIAEVMASAPEPSVPEPSVVPEAVPESPVALEAEAVPEVSAKEPKAVPKKSRDLFGPASERALRAGFMDKMAEIYPPSRMGSRPDFAQYYMDSADQAVNILRSLESARINQGSEDLVNSIAESFGRDKFDELVSMLDNPPNVGMDVKDDIRAKYDYYREIGKKMAEMLQPSGILGEPGIISFTEPDFMPGIFEKVPNAIDEILGRSREHIAEIPDETNQARILSYAPEWTYSQNMIYTGPNYDMLSNSARSELSSIGVDRETFPGFFESLRDYFRVLDDKGAVEASRLAPELASTELVGGETVSLPASAEYIIGLESVPIELRKAVSSGDVERAKEIYRSLDQKGRHTLREAGIPDEDYIDQVTKKVMVRRHRPEGIDLVARRILENPDIPDVLKNAIRSGNEPEAMKYYRFITGGDRPLPTETSISLAGVSGPDDMREMVRHFRPLSNPVVNIVSPFKRGAVSPTSPELFLDEMRRRYGEWATDPDEISKIIKHGWSSSSLSPRLVSEVGDLGEYLNYLLMYRQGLIEKVKSILGGQGVSSSVGPAGYSYVPIPSSDGIEYEIHEEDEDPGFNPLLLEISRAYAA